MFALGAPGKDGGGLPRRARADDRQTGDVLQRSRECSDATRLGIRPCHHGDGRGDAVQGFRCARGGDDDRGQHGRGVGPDILRGGGGREQGEEGTEAGAASAPFADC